MPEIRNVEVYKSGTDKPELDHLEPYEVSDKELERERAEKVVAELSALPDTELTTARLGKLIKALARLRS